MHAIKGSITAAVLWLHLLFSRLAWAYGPLWRFEGAFYCSVYIMEEIRGIPGLENNGYQTASGCVGTRVGLAGQAGWCNLAEFLDYIGRETATGKLDEDGNPIYDKRPDRGNVE